MNLQTSTPPSQVFWPNPPRWIPPEAQEARLTQLAEIRIQRPLTDDERAERENLERRQYFRNMNRDRAYGARGAMKGGAL